MMLVDDVDEVDSDNSDEEPQKLRDEFGELDDLSDAEAEEAADQDTDDDDDDGIGGNRLKSKSKAKAKVAEVKEGRMFDQVTKATGKAGIVFGNQDKQRQTRQEEEEKRRQMEALFGDHGEKRESFSMTGFYKNKQKFFDEKDEEAKLYAVSDPWLNQVDALGPTQLAKEAAKASAMEDEDEDEFNPWEAKRFLMRHLLPGENFTVLNALRKLKAPASARPKAPPKKNIRKKQRLAMEAAAKAAREKAGENKEQEEKRKQDFNKVTKYAQRLMMDGDTRIYEATYDTLRLQLRRYQEANRAREQSAARASAKRKLQASQPVDAIWEYKWSAEESKVHGPFTPAQMMKWKSEDFFKGGAVCRRRGQTSWDLIEFVPTFLVGPARPSAKKFKF
jgi:hypothetical protein